MYSKNNLYKTYIKNISEKQFSSTLPDVTKRRTLELINTAINCCEDWDLALDIGGGNGHYSASLVDKFKEIRLVEPTQHDEHTTLTQTHKNYTVIHKMIEEVDIQEPVDFIMLCDLFEHIVDIQSFLRKVSSMQQTGGVVYILTPNPLFCGPAIQSEIHNSKIGIYGHERHYFRHEILKLMEENKYTLIHESFEESPIREFTRRIIRGISRRQLTLEQSTIYKKYISRIIVTLLSPLWYTIGKITYASELRCKNDCEHSKSSVYIFKKI